MSKREIEQTVKAYEAMGISRKSALEEIARQEKRAKWRRELLNSKDAGDRQLGRWLP